MPPVTGRRPSMLALGRGNRTGVPAGWRSRPRCCCSADEAGYFLVDGDQRLAFHLPVVVPQVGGAVAVVCQAAGRQPGRVGDPQPAADEDEGDQLVGRVVPAAEAGGVFDLGHDVLGQRARQQLAPAGEVLGEEHRRGRQAGVPLVAADVAQEQADLPDVVALAGRVAAEVGQVAFEDVPADLAGPGDPGRGQERGEPRDRPHAAVAGDRRQPARQPPSGPPLGQVLQPRLADRRELQGDDGLGVDPQPAQLPGVAGVLVVPAFPFGQRGDLAVGVDQQRGRLPGPGGIGRAGLAPGLLAAVEQRDRSAGGQPPDHGPDRGRLGLHHVVVPPALQGVLHFQPQLRGQRGQVRALMVAVCGLLVAGDEPGQAGAAESFPPPVVVVAQHRARVRPQRAEADLAGGLPRLRGRRRRRREPAVDVRLPGPDPCAQVPLA